MELENLDGIDISIPDEPLFGEIGRFELGKDTFKVLEEGSDSASAYVVAESACKLGMGYTSTFFPIVVIII